MKLSKRLAVLAAAVVSPPLGFTAVVTGTDGAEALVGTMEADVLDGHEGDDVLIGGLGDDTLTGGIGFDVAFVKALRRELECPGSCQVESPDGTDTIHSDVEQVRFIDGSLLLAPLAAPLVTADDVLLLPAWTAADSTPVSIAISQGGNGISAITVTGHGASFDLTPPSGGRLAGIDLGSVTGTVSITGVTFAVAHDTDADGVAASSNIGRLMFDDRQISVSINGNAADRFKALFLTFDPLYVAGIPPEAKYFANLKFLELGVEYAQYLDSGGAPILDYVVKTTGMREQTLHDNLLGNLTEPAVVSRANGNAYQASATSGAIPFSTIMDEYMAGTAGAAYVDRPYHDGVPTKAAAADATRWDIARGLARPGHTISDGTALRARDADGDGSVDTISSHTTAQAAIDAAVPDDIVALTNGIYPEALALTKPLTIRAAGGATVRIDPPDTLPALSIQSNVGAGAVTLQRLYIEGGTHGVLVATDANVGTLAVQQVSIADNSKYGLFVWGNGEGSNGAATVVIRDSAFAGNGFQTNSNLNGSSNIKLFGFTGHATLTNVLVTGEGMGAARADYGIDLVGVPNEKLSAVQPTTALGTVHFTNVTVNGVFEKNALAFYNYGNLDDLTLQNVDLSASVTEWDYVLNIDGITADVDASQYEVELPIGTAVQASVQGDKIGQPAIGQGVTGTASNDIVAGKSGNDLLRGGPGDDRIYGHDKPGQPQVGETGDDVLYGEQGDDFLDGGLGSDRLYGGPDDDRLYGGDDAAVDWLFGGEGFDEAIFVGAAAEYRLDHESRMVDAGGDGGSETVFVVKVTRLSDGSFDYANGVERLVFVTDVHGYALEGEPAIGSAVPGIVVNISDSSGHDTLQAAMSAAASGSTIEIAGALDLSGEGPIQVTQNDITVRAANGTTVAGFVLGSGVTTFTLAGEFDADVIGNAAANRIRGSAGANVIDGGGGNDTLIGGGGNDRLVGGGGNDLIASTAGNDVVVGGAGDDRIVISTSSGATTVISGGSGADTFIIGAIDPDTSVAIAATIVDFVPGTDTLNLGDLQRDDTALTLPALALGAPSTQTTVNLADLRIDGGTGTASGSITLYLLDEPTLDSRDFIFTDAQESWRTDIGAAP